MAYLLGEKTFTCPQWGKLVFVSLLVRAMIEQIATVAFNKSATTRLQNYLYDTAQMCFALTALQFFPVERH